MNKQPIHTTLSKECRDWIRKESGETKKYEGEIIEDAVDFYRKNKTVLQEYKQARVFIKEIIEEAVQPGANTDLPPITEDILGPEEMIERYLKKCGGQAYQVDIVNESDLSESKVSLVLSKMKDEGRILKIQKGKKNVIRLIKKE